MTAHDRPAIIVARLAVPAWAGSEAHHATGLHAGRRNPRRPLEEGKFGNDLKEVRLSSVRIDDGGDDVPAQPDTTPLTDEEIPF